MPISFDAIVIGAGQAGPSLAAALAKQGMKTAIVERHLFGGTCVNTGCIPSKTLIANARVAHMINRSNDYGINIQGPIAIDMSQVKKRKDAIVQRSTQGVEQWLRNTNGITVFNDHGHFVDHQQIAVGDEILTGSKIFINVGARALVPPFPGLDKINYYTNSSIMDVDFLPEHLLIIGGSYIGLEFAQMYRRFGSKVTVVEKSTRIISREDEDISTACQEILENEGIEIRLNANCIGFKPSNNGIIANVDCESGDNSINASHLLLAVGREPNTQDLGLEKVGIETNERGFIQVDEQLQTTAPGVWALGECNGQGAFTHTSYNDYQIIAENLLNNGKRSIDERILCYGLFIDPPLARIGLTENQATQSYKNVLVATRPMSRVSRAVEKGETQGFMKILVDGDSKFILGAAILGVDGDEAIHTILSNMYSQSPYTTLLNAVHIHPTVAELIPTLLEGLKPISTVT